MPTSVLYLVTVLIWGTSWYAMELQLADAGSPTLVRDGADESALYVLMPMRV